MEALEDKKRPVWEDIDTQQVLKDIKASDNLNMFSQRIMVRYKMQQEEQLKEEDKEDYFDKIFSEIREEPMAVMPDIFNLGMKFSSDKHPQDTDLKRSNSMCSRSFDQELIDHGKNNHKPLPAFRNHRVQKGINSETPTKESQSHSLEEIESVNNYGNPNITYSQQRVFCKLIPNNQAKVWHYRDLEGMIQGPYSSQLMDGWYNKGYLPLDLEVTIANSRGFRRIRDIVEIASNIRDSVLLPTNLNPKAFNSYNTTKSHHNDNDLDETENEINNSIENIISENCCPNVQYNFVQNAIPKVSNASYPYIQESDRLHFDRSVNKPSQVYHSNQFQGFDYNRNYLRNLPR